MPRTGALLDPKRGELKPVLIYLMLHLTVMLNLSQPRVRLLQTSPTPSIVLRLDNPNEEKFERFVDAATRAAKASSYLNK